MPRRPKDALPPELAAHLPLFGRDPLLSADVAVMISPAFHDDPRFTDPVKRRRFAARGAALVAMPALAGLRDEAVAGIRVADYDLETGMIATKVQTRELELPATPALRAVLDHWLGQRPTDKGDAMFPSDRGQPNHSSIGQFLRHLGWRLGAQRQLSTLLAEFHRANLAHGGPGAYSAYWGIQTSRLSEAAPTGKALKVLVKAIDPFGVDIAFLASRADLAAFIAGADTGLPPAAYMTAPLQMGQRLPADHPLAVALSATLVADRYDRADAFDALFDNFTPMIDDVVATGQATMTSLWQFCRMNHKVWARRLEAARRGEAAGGRKQRPRPAAKPARPPKPAPTVAEMRRLKDIDGARWKGTTDTIRRSLLKDHFPFVRRLLSERKITYKRARKLFRLTVKGVTLRCFDHDNGVLHLATGPRPNLKARREARALAIWARSEFPDIGITDLWKKIRLDYLYPMDFPDFQGVVRNHAAGRHKRIGGITAPLPWRERRT